MNGKSAPSNEDASSTWAIYLVLIMIPAVALWLDVTNPPNEGDTPKAHEPSRTEIDGTGIKRDTGLAFRPYFYDTIYNRDFQD